MKQLVSLDAVRAGIGAGIQVNDVYNNAVLCQ